ncbi:MAG: two-component regulator propeller domain-containing protein [bacterium]
MKKCVYFVVILIFTSNLFAQYPQWVKITDDRVYSVAEGHDSYFLGKKTFTEERNKLTGENHILNLPWNADYIYDLLFDNGILWIGSWSGLGSFQNGKWDIYNKTNTGLIQSPVRSLAIDSLGNLWMVKYDGLNNFDGIKFEDFYNIEYFKKWGALHSLICDRNNRIWFQSNGRLLYMYNDSITLVLDTNSETLKDRWISSLYLDKNDNLILNTSKGLMKYNGSEFIAMDSINNLLPLPKTSKIAYDRNNDLWVLNNDKLFRIQDSQAEIFDSSDHEYLYEITDFVIDSSNCIYISCGYGYHLYKFDGKNWDQVEFSYPSFNAEITEMMVDKKNNLWLITINGGTICLNDSTRRVYDPIFHGQLPGEYGGVSAIAVEPDNTIWIGNFFGDIAKFNGNEWTVYYAADFSLPSNGVTNIVKDSIGNIWVGTPNGAGRYDSDQWSRFNIAERYERFNISALVIDKKNNICIGNQNKLVIKSDSGFALYRLPDYTWATICDIDIDSKNNKWLVTGADKQVIMSDDYSVGAGLFEFEGDSLRRYDTTNSLIPSNDLTSLSIDKLDKKWIGTIGKGVVLFDDNTWKEFNTENSGLLNDTILTIFIDSYDNKWIGTNSGLCVYREGGVILNVDENDITNREKSIIFIIPNPFSESTKFKFKLDKPANVNLAIYNSLGQEIAVLCDEWKTEGEHEINFNGSNLNSGIYYYKFSVGSENHFGKVVLIR